MFHSKLTPITIVAIQNSHYSHWLPGDSSRALVFFIHLIGGPKKSPIFSGHFLNNTPKQRVTLFESPGFRRCLFHLQTPPAAGTSVHHLIRSDKGEYRKSLGHRWPGVFWKNNSAWWSVFATPESLATEKMMGSKPHAFPFWASALGANSLKTSRAQYDFQCATSHFANSCVIQLYIYPVIHMCSSPIFSKKKKTQKPHPHRNRNPPSLIQTKQTSTRHETEKVRRLTEVRSLGKISSFVTHFGLSCRDSLRKSRIFFTVSRPKKRETNDFQKPWSCLDVPRS